MTYFLKIAVTEIVMQLKKSHGSKKYKSFHLVMVDYFLYCSWLYNTFSFFFSNSSSDESTSSSINLDLEQVAELQQEFGSLQIKLQRLKDSIPEVGTEDLMPEDIIVLCKSVLHFYNDMRQIIKLMGGFRFDDDLYNFIGIIRQKLKEMKSLKMTRLVHHLFESNCKSVTVEGATNKMSGTDYGIKVDEIKVEVTGTTNIEDDQNASSDVENNETNVANENKTKDMNETDPANTMPDLSTVRQAYQRMSQINIEMLETVKARISKLKESGKLRVLESVDDDAIAETLGENCKFIFFWSTT